MNKLYVKCDGCDGCKRYMLEDSREENDFCNGTGFRTADGKSVKQIRLEKEGKASLERIHAFVEELKQSGRSWDRTGT